MSRHWGLFVFVVVLTVIGLDALKYVDAGPGSGPMHAAAPVCGNNVCERGELGSCPSCVYNDPPCSAQCIEGTCPRDCSQANQRIEETCVLDPESYWDEELQECVSLSRMRTCSDPDLGVNQYRKARTFGFIKDPQRDEDTRLRIAFHDECIAHDRVLEHYCFQGKYVESIEITCDEACRDGACTEEPYCSDTDEEDPSVKGHLKTNARGWERNTTDHCVVGNSVGGYRLVQTCRFPDCYVQEFVCQAGLPTKLPPTLCRYGCSEGKCKDMASCTDSDDGMKIHNPGTVEATGHQTEKDQCLKREGSRRYISVDECSGGTCYVLEYSCAGTKLREHEPVRCTQGCSRGACAVPGPGPGTGPGQELPPNTCDFSVCPHGCRNDGSCRSEPVHTCDPHQCDDGVTFPRCDEKGRPISYFENPCLQVGRIDVSSVVDVYQEVEQMIDRIRGSQDGSGPGPGSENLDESLTFKDLNPETEVARAAASFKDKGVLTGYPDGTFRAGDYVNRAQAAKMLVQAVYGSGIDLRFSIARFTDVEQDAWYSPSVSKAVYYGIISGYPDGSFRPSNHITTAELLAMLSRALNAPAHHTLSFSDVPHNAWFSQYAGLAKQYELFPERGDRLQPNRYITRGELVVALWRLLES